MFFTENRNSRISYYKVVKNITKYCVIRNPNNCLYEVQKAIYLCKSGRPGPVWIEIPLDVQAHKIKNFKKLKKFKEPVKKIGQKIKLKKFIDLINNSKKPLFIVGNGVKQSNTSKNFRYLSKRLKIPFLTSRFALDLYPSL